MNIKIFGFNATIICSFEPIIESHLRIDSIIGFSIVRNILSLGAGQ